MDNSGVGSEWDITAGSQKAFEQMLDDFASVSGYNELKYAPIVPFGHSAMATIRGTLRPGIPTAH